MKKVKKIDFFLAKITIFFILLYQKTLSPDHGVFHFWYPHGFCRFFPSCSEYGKKAFQKNGFRKGLILALFRIFRCNPFGKGGYDPVK